MKITKLTYELRGDVYVTSIKDLKDLGEVDTLEDLLKIFDQLNKKLKSKSYLTVDRSFECIRIIGRDEKMGNLVEYKFEVHTFSLKDRRLLRNWMELQENGYFLTGGSGD